MKSVVTLFVNQKTMGHNLLGFLIDTPSTPSELNGLQNYQKSKLEVQKKINNVAEDTNNVGKRRSNSAI